MTESRINYLGAASAASSDTNGRGARSRRLHWSFLIVVVIPTLMAAVYFLLIATPRYVSEAQFIVRAPNQGQQPSSLGVALQGVGLSSTQTDAFAVHEYIKSRDGLNELRAHLDVARILDRPGVDVFSRYPRPWENRSNEGLYNGFRRFVVVGYDSTTGISELRVEAFSARDANALATGLLGGGERLVNRLNERSSRDAVAYAEAALERAQARVEQSRQNLLAFQTRERFLDPQLDARESSELIGALRATVAQLQAERSQIAQSAPSSPQLPALDSRIASYQQQIVAERGKLAGGATSLAPKAGVYEGLVLDRELADRQLTQASVALVAAEQDVVKQKLYLDKIVRPSMPDEPEQPKRWFSILTVLATALGAYGIGRLTWAGVREHRHG